MLKVGKDWVSYDKTGGGPWPRQEKTKKGDMMSLFVKVIIELLLYGVVVLALSIIYVAWTSIGDKKSGRS